MKIQIDLLLRKSDKLLQESDKLIKENEKLRKENRNLKTRLGKLEKLVNENAVFLEEKPEKMKLLDGLTRQELVKILEKENFISMNQRSGPAYLQRVFEFELSLILLIVSKPPHSNYLHIIIPHRLFSGF